MVGDEVIKELSLFVCFGRVWERKVGEEACIEDE